MPRPLVTSRISNCPLAHRDPEGAGRSPSLGLLPRPVFPDHPPPPPGGSAPPGARPRARTARCDAEGRRLRSRSVWRSHSPVGGARRAGGAAGRGSSRGRPRASPSRPAAPRHAEAAAGGSGGGGTGTQLAPSLPPSAPSARHLLPPSGSLLLPGLQSPPSTRSPPAPPPFPLLSSHCPSRERLSSRRLAPAETRRRTELAAGAREGLAARSPGKSRTERLQRERDAGAESRVSRTDS